MDLRGRCAWYHLCFSVVCPPGAHQEMAQLFCAEGCEITSDILTSACLSTHDSIAVTLFEHVCTATLLNKPTVRGKVSFAFTGLQLLDDPSTRVVWADGSVDVKEAETRTGMYLSHSCLFLPVSLCWCMSH